jgi:hypothetical protein
MRRLIRGVAAGAVGTEALNVTTYLDMAIRGRPASPLPEQDVAAMAERAGVSLGRDPQTAANRRSAIGALLGYVAGAAMGAVYGLVRPLARGVPQPVAVAAVGLGAMVATNAGSVRLGTTDPRTWSAQDWAADVIPHLAYGAGAVLAYDALMK